MTTSRFDAAYIVTEYGVAFLRGKNIRRRAEALIAVAAPQFRDQLQEEFRALCGYV
ncbi:MAG: acetyl-CoA hydrolase/transferase C-terminal domain-containing protein [Syntrophobacteraceae bacterium]